MNPDGSVSIFEIPADEDAMRIVQPQPVEPVSAQPLAPPPEAPRREDNKRPAPLEVRGDFIHRVLSAGATNGRSAKPSPEQKPDGNEVSLPEREYVAGMPPLPGRKPEKPLSRREVYESYKAEAAAAQVEGEPIPRNAALAIAIKNSPPAKDFKVFQAMHGGRPVYAVVFDLEAGGRRDVLVDALTGEIVKK